eukprot:148385_1
MSCCKRRAGFSPHIVDDIRRQLRRISNVFPGCTFTCVLAPDIDKSITERMSSEQYNVDEMFSSVNSFVNAAKNFATALQMSSCNSMHIHGTNSLFSCYIITPNSDELRWLLALFSRQDGKSLQNFSTDTADKEMEDINLSLAALLRNIDVGGR